MRGVLTSKTFWIVATAVLALGLVAFWLAAPPSGSTKQSIDVPAIGGPFGMVDQDGNPFTQDDLKGHFSLVYFGYTYCPDVCPTALSAIAEALDLLGEDGDRILPIFVTIDPERDTPEQMKMYVQHFHPRLIGLTGTSEQVAAMAKAYRVYFAKVREENAVNDDDYLMDHTAIVYLMDEAGKFRAHFPHGTDAKTMADKIRSYL